MKAKNRLEIVWETHEITTISFKENYSRTAFCQSCRTETPHLSLEQVVFALSISEPEIRCLADESKIHSSFAANGTLLVCCNSLAAIKQKQNKQQK